MYLAGKPDISRVSEDSVELSVGAVCVCCDLRLPFTDTWQLMESPSFKCSNIMHFKDTWSQIKVLF